MAITDDIVARAQADLQQALNRASKAKAQLDDAEREASDLHAFLRTLQRYTAPVTDSVRREHVSNTISSAAKPGARGIELVDTCIEAIRHVGRPMKIGELLDVVLNAGMVIGGADQKSNLAGYLSRDPRVHSLGRSVGWDTVENEEAASVPASDDAASSQTEGGSDDRTTLVSDPDEALRRELFGES